MEKAGGGRVGGYGLVMFAFCSECVRKADPSWAKVWIHHGRFGEEAACFGNATDGKVIDAYSEPGSRFVWVVISEIMGEQEKGIFLIELVQAS